MIKPVFLTPGAVKEACKLSPPLSRDRRQKQEQPEAEAAVAAGALSLKVVQSDRSTARYAAAPESVPAGLRVGSI
jgi:hypothetical protein